MCIFFVCEQCCRRKVLVVNGLSSDLQPKLSTNPSNQQLIDNIRNTASLIEDRLDSSLYKHAIPPITPTCTLPSLDR